MDMGKVGLIRVRTHGLILVVQYYQPLAPAVFSTDELDLFGGWRHVPEGNFL